MTSTGKRLVAMIILLMFLIALFLNFFIGNNSITGFILNTLAYWVVFLILAAAVKVLI